MKTETQRPRIKNPLVYRAADLEDDIRRQLEPNGLRLAVSWPQSGQTVTSHWRVLRPDGEVLAHYWPSSGKWFSPVGRQRGNIARPEQLVDLANRLGFRQT
jgi:hypothetical protein